MSLVSEEKSEQLSLDIVDAEVKPFYWVNQSNDLINSRQDLDLTQRRIIYALVSLVQPEDKDFKTYMIQIKELANLIGVSGNSFYERVEAAVDGLQSKYFVIEEEDEHGNKDGIVHKINWIQQATYIKNEGLIKIKLSDTLAEYLMNLKKYTGYQLFNVLQLKSEYSWRVYELLKEREKWNKRVITVTELRKLLNIPDDKLTLMHQFKRVVLEKAKDEINKKTDISFEYEVYKKVGKKIHSFVFYITNNKNNIGKLRTEDAVNYDIQSLCNRLITLGVRSDKAVDFIQKYPPKYIEENIQYVKQSNQVTNLAGYLVKAIEANYANSVYEYEEYEHSFYRLQIGNYNNKIKEMNSKDIKSLLDIITFYDDMILKSKGEDIQQIAHDRETNLFLKLDEILALRKKNNYIPLTLSDVEDTKIAPFFKQYIKEKSKELPY